MLKSVLFFLCVVAAGGRLEFFWRYETKVAHCGIFCFGLVNYCRPRRAVRQFWWCESNVAHSEIFCFGEGRYWRGRWVGGGGSAKNGGAFPTGYGQVAGLGDPRRARRGTKGRERRCGGNWWAFKREPASCRIALCVRAGETATTQRLCAPERCRFQTGLRSGLARAVPTTAVAQLLKAERQLPAGWQTSIKPCLIRVSFGSVVLRAAFARTVVNGCTARVAKGKCQAPDGCCGRSPSAIA